MTSSKKKKIQFGKLYYNLCNAMNESFCGKSFYPFNVFSIYFLVAVAIVLPIISGQVYFQSAWHIAIEIVFFLFFVGFLSCTLFFYKKSIWHWCIIIILLLHYVSLIDIIAGNQEFGLLYLGLATVFFVSYASWKSAKDVNRKGGLIDTLILAIGIACCVLGVILMKEQNQYGKTSVIIGISLIYIYAIARALFWLIYTQEKIKLNLIKTMIYVCFYLALIIGLPFFLFWAGVGKDALCNVIIPIYASVIGGALALAGVAWTIQFTKNERLEQDKKRDEERKEEERKKFVPYVKLCSSEKAKSCVDAYFYKGIDLGQDSAKLKDRTFYLASIKNFTIKNISETNIIMCGAMINKIYYPFDSNLILESGESCSVCTTKNVCVNLAEEISEIFLVVQDILQNFYCLNCRIESNVNVTMPYLTTRIHDEEYTGFRMDYQINSIELPALLTKEPTNE